MTDANAAAAAAPAAPAAAPQKKERKPKKVLTKSQQKRKVAKIMDYLHKHPKQLAQERKRHQVDHLHPRKEKAGETKPAEKKKVQRHPFQVPESVLIRKKARLRTIARRALKAKEQHQKDVRFKGILVKRAERHLAEYRAKEKELVHNRRVARMSGNFFREPDARLILVIRLKGIMGLSPRTRKILRLLRLRQINNAAFVRVNKATLQMLRLVSPYVAFGYPNLATVRKLLYKRGYARYHGRRVPIVDNKLIHHKLGKYNIICMEDLLHEIYTVGPYFKQANKFLWAFKLRNPIGGFSRKSVSYVEGGDAGNREEKINSLVRRML